MTMRDKTDQELADIHAEGTTDYGKVRMIMQGERYAIFRWPGGYWWDNGGKHYGSVNYCLALKGERRFGFRRANTVTKEWEGRVSKRELRKALDEAEAQEKGSAE
jgi:hypothetical protein